jgi:hypothetical protein
VAVKEAKALLDKNASNAAVLFPYLIGEDLVGAKDSRPTRYVIDFQGKDLLEAQKFKDLFQRLQSGVLPTRQKAAGREYARNKEALKANPAVKTNRHHANFLKKWWQLSYAREDMVEVLSALPRYIACARITKRPIFEFVSSAIRPNDVVQVFPYPDDYSFGILQSGIHWVWFTNRCSTLTERFRYTSNTVFDSFVWPQSPSEKSVRRVADAAVALRKLRWELRDRHGLSFRELYRSLELPGDHPLKYAHAKLDDAVRLAYGMTRSEDALGFLLSLNQEAAAAEADGGVVQGPGLPEFIKDRKAYITNDCIPA